MGVNKIAFGETTLIDLTSDTVASSYLASGYTAHDRTGSVITGTMPTPEGTLSITSNGTYNVSQYASAIVDVAGGGGDDLFNQFLGSSLTGDIYNSEIKIIKSYFFQDVSGSYTVDFPACVTIGSSAFFSAGITAFSFPSAKYVGIYAFYSCKNLSHAPLPGVTTIGTNTFWGCTSLTKVEAPNLQTVGSSAFYYTNLEAFPFSNVSSIGVAAFGFAIQAGSPLSIVSLPSLSMALSSRAFYMCSGIKEVYLNNPSTVTIYSQAFSGCISLEKIEAPYVTTLFSYQVFAGCSNLKSILLSQSVIIGTCAFQSCYLTNEVLDPVLSGATAIGISAFMNNRLSYVNIPACSVIARDAFLGNPISSFIANQLREISSIAYLSSTLQFFQADMATTLNSYAFYRLSLLSELSLPAVSSVAVHAFNTSAPLSLTLTGLSVVPSTRYAFYGNSWIHTLVLSSVTHFFSNALYGCSRLISLDLRRVRSVPNMSHSNALLYTPIAGATATAGQVGSIYVPASLYTSFTMALNWSYYSSRMVSV